MNVSVIGLGKLGSPMAAFYASRGHTVIGVDTNPEFVSKVNAHQAPVEEAELQELIGRHSRSLRAVSDVGEAIRETDLTFVIVPTPSRPDGEFSLDYILVAAREIGRALRGKDYHNVVITSTVMPGDTDGRIRPVLEEESGKRCGEGFGLCYSPEFIALGSVIHDLRNPDFILLGQSDPKAGERLEAFYATLFDQPRPVARMSSVNAELAKLAVNTYVTTKITFANMLADICRALPGGDVTSVTTAVGLDRRIGKQYLRAAVPYGGPCFPRDNKALVSLAARLGASADIASATDELNRKWMDRIAEQIAGACPAGSRVALLGLSYKPSTPVITESPGIAIAELVVARGARVTVYDPAAMENARAVLGDKVGYAASAAEAVRGAQAVAIVTAWPEFADLTAADFDAAGGPVTIFDCWGQIDANQIGPAARIVRVGVNMPTFPLRGPLPP